MRDREAPGRRAEGREWTSKRLLQYMFKRNHTWKVLDKPGVYE